MNKLCVLAATGCAIALSAAAGPIPGLFNTGVNSNGTALLVSGSIDPHYQLVQSADPSFPGPDARVLNDSGFPIPPWLANGPNSKWIAPQTSQAVGNQPGDYKYRITFDLSTVDHFTAVITGQWSSDNAGAAVLLNGVETGITYDGNFAALSPVFTISSGFVEGTNTLDFVVNNGAPGVNPTGFRAEISGTADPLPPPGTAPSIVQGPVSQTNGLGESATFSVKVYGSRPLSYRWRFNSQPIPNATNSTLTLNLLTTADDGDYDVVVTNPAGSATTLPARLTVAVLSPAQLTFEPLGPSSRRTGLAISEIMYHPKDRDDGRNLEFVELYNSNPFAEDISGHRFSGAFDYTFPPNTIIAGNGFLVVAPVPADIQAQYGISGVLGGYTNNLPNNAGLIRLRKKSGAPVLEVPYQDSPPWPVAADGVGHSLVLAKPSLGERDPHAWAASAYIGGSPGAADPIPSGALENVMINEILANTDPPLLDFVELYNHSPVAVDLSGCYLTDERNTNIFRIPNGTVLAAGSFMAFDQNELQFALSAAGETVYFINSNATRVIDALRYDAQATGVSYGRYPDADGRFQALSSRTPGAANAPRLIPSIVINEIMYNPISGSNDDEYVELYNRTGSAVDVGGWRLTEGVTYTIPNGVMIAPNGYLVVAGNASRLLTNYPGLSSGVVFGNFNGNLSNGGERIALSRPEVVVETNANLTIVTNTYYVLVNDVTYRDGGRWGRLADGAGSSLELIDPHSDNQLPSNWADSDETRKSQWTAIDYSGVADLGHPSSSSSDQLQVFLLGAGEALVDDVQVFLTGSTNRILNSTFDTDTNYWAAQGTQRLSSWSSEGYQSGGSLHLVATERGDHVANRARTSFSQAIPANANVTMHARARWLNGHPEILFRLRGGFLEAFGRLAVPANLGTPGAENSRLALNAGPAITEVSHRPVLPQPGEAIRVTARVHDPDGIGAVILHYRVDPAPWSSGVTAAMNDQGINGDYMAGDGIYTGIIPAQASRVLMAFYVEASDQAAFSRTTRFPSDAPARECLVRIGDAPLSNAFGTYRFWMTQAAHDFWGGREKMSNEDIDATFIYGKRIVYNIGAHFSGSSYTAPTYTTPTGALCGYDLHFPDDDLMLGEDHLTLDWPIRDSTNQREQLMFWFLEQFGLPNMYRRYINLFVNGVKRGTIYDDVQQPAGETIEEWFADDAEGNLYKTDCWNEFDNAGNRVDPCVLNSLEIFTTAGAKKVARYRWNWRPRAIHGTANDFSDLFALIDAANTQGSPYQSAVESVVDMDHWMRTFCMNDLASFWDAFGNPNAKNTYLYKPENSGWKLFSWDFDVGLGVFNDPVTDPLFPTNIDPVVLRMFNYPAFIRAYWRAMQEAMNGFFQVGPGTAIDFILDSKYAAFQANGIALESPAAIKTWITQRRAFILPQMNSATNAPFNLSGTNYITTSRNLVTLSGTAPVRVQSILINGVAYPPVWTTLTTWNITLAVAAGTNQIRIDALDAAGNTNATRTVTIEYTGQDELAQDRLVINEIMYNPLIPETSYVEIYNRSQNYSYDLSNWRIDGLGFTFGGTIITNGQYLVIAKNRQAFGSAYGWNIPALAPFGGQLDDGGETLTLLQPAQGGADPYVIDRVTYDDDPPWPAAPDGSGPSLQLIDAAQDNNRVSNWSDGSGWKSFSFTGSSGVAGNRLSLFLTNIPADLFIDDIAFVEGTVPGAGTNLILNGGFESATLSPWNKTAIATNSAIDTSAAHTGLQSLHLVFGAGSPQLTHFYQDLTNVIASGVKPNTVYTLSFWYLTGTNSLLMQTRLNSTFRTATDVRAIGYTPGAPNNIARSLPPYPPLWISEVQPQNLTGPADSAGDRDPWVELYLSGLSGLGLSGYYLSDNYADLKKWSFPPSTAINAGQFMLLWTDAEPGETSSTELHTSFRLNPTNGVVALSRDVDGVPQIVDYINYRNVPADQSFGGFPDGQSSFRLNFYYPTPGATNNPTAAPVAVFINEWMAGNTRTLADPADGDFDDWFELYNASSKSVDLSGYSVTDQLSNARKFIIPAGFVIPAHGYMLFWADEEGNQNRAGRELHVNFRLSASGEAIGLFDPYGRAIDVVTFSRQTDDISEGRFPDGPSAIFSMSTPTPRAANLVATPEVRLLSISYDPAVGVSLMWTAQSGKTYRVEYKNDLAEADWIPLAGVVLADSDTASKTDNTITSVRQRFYRIVHVP